MGKLYYCDYCDRSFVDDLQARKKHLQSTAHLRNRKLHYLSCRDLETLVEEESIKEECYKFKNSGQCQFGENCYRSHFTRQQLNMFRKQIAEEKSHKALQDIAELKTVESWLEKRSTIMPCDQPLTHEKAVHSTVPCPQPGGVYFSSSFRQQVNVRRNLPLSLQPIKLEELKDAKVSEWG